ncbi:MAG: response regulator [Rubrivivax sp.]|nr:response regulator [Rubrivivax sp.]
MSGTTPSLRRWLPLLAGLAAASLVLMLGAAAWLQVRQHRLLDATVRFQDDYLQVSIAQLQVEFQRLRSALHEAAAAPDPGLQRGNVQLRYDIFVSRADLLVSGRAERLVADAAELRQAVLRTRQFVEFADRFLGPNPVRGFDGAAVRELLAGSQPLDEPLLSLVLSSAHVVTTLVAERYDSVREQAVAGAVLTTLLSLGSVGFGVMALWLLRQESLRRRALEAMTRDLRSARFEAERASQAKSVFLANMSHEIRTPFHGMMTMLQLLAAGELNPRQRRQMQTAHNAADHLLAVLDDMLDMSRLESGTLALRPGPVDVRSLVAEVYGLTRSAAVEKDLTFEPPHFGPGVPRALDLDPTRLRQILLNLVSNAIRFTERGRVGIEVQVTTEELWIAVTDTGAGVDAGIRRHLFERFSLGDQTLARGTGGAGLGLFISRRLARLMGGDIEVESASGLGSRFTVHLPLQLASTASAAEAPPLAPTAPAASSPDHTAAAAEPPGHPPATPAGRLSILAAENDDLGRLVLRSMLDHLGHHVQFVRNGQEAVEAVEGAAAGGIDVVLMDLHMPELGGLEAAHRIRQLRPPAGQVPIIVVTADATADTRQRCAEAGLGTPLTKPFKLGDLEARLATCTMAARTAAAAGGPLRTVRPQGNA